ncbi:Reticulon-3 [Thelohanellus kitauei]|uniref:Reticulon-like protein n=1 Tax=Thelohanellus kitauei TaxID=669202 RepID=A0A0C2ISM8_THEKT|nr:Reticulon-3 [Thelohanellus kitauei]
MTDTTSSSKSNESCAAPFCKPLVTNTKNKLYVWLSDHLHPNVVDLIFWKCPLKSGAVMFSVLFAVFCFSRYRPHVVLAAAFLSLTLAGLLIKLWVVGFKSVQRSEIAHPFTLACDACTTVFSSSENKEMICQRFTCLTGKLRSIVAHQSIFYVILALVIAYIIYSFNGFVSMTFILYVVDIMIFTVPAFYVCFETQCDKAFAEIGKSTRNLISTIDKNVPPSAKEKLIKIGLYPSDKEKSS